MSPFLLTCTLRSEGSGSGRPLDCWTWTRLWCEQCLFHWSAGLWKCSQNCTGHINQSSQVLSSGDGHWQTEAFRGDPGCSLDVLDLQTQNTLISFIKQFKWLLNKRFASVMWSHWEKLHCLSFQIDSNYWSRFFKGDRQIFKSGFLFSSRTCQVISLVCILFIVKHCVVKWEVNGSESDTEIRDV